MQQDVHCPHKPGDYIRHYSTIRLHSRYCIEVQAFISLRGKVAEAVNNRASYTLKRTPAWQDLICSPPQFESACGIPLTSKSPGQLQLQSYSCIKFLLPCTPGLGMSTSFCSKDVYALKMHSMLPQVTSAMHALEGPCIQQNQYTLNACSVQQSVQPCIME